MKIAVIMAAISAAAKVFAYQCPDSASIDLACLDINVSPLVCSDPVTDIDSCNIKQCNQPYVDNYAACQCRRSATTFYENSMNVDGLLRRCDATRLVNPYGSPSQYRPGEGTRLFIARVNGTSTRDTSTQTAAPIIAPTESLTTTQEEGISGGAIAGIVIGCLVALALAILLFWFWRKKRHQHMAVYDSYTTMYGNRGPIRTVATEKVEPVVVKAGSLQSTHKTTEPMPVDQHYNSTAFDHNAAHSSTSYNATPLNSYDTDTGFNAHTGTKR